jgi:hypothetical protein
MKNQETAKENGKVFLSSNGTLVLGTLVLFAKFFILGGPFV